MTKSYSLNGEYLAPCGHAFAHSRIEKLVKRMDRIFVVYNCSSCGTYGTEASMEDIFLTPQQKEFLETDGELDKITAWLLFTSKSIFSFS
jgi:hypothetical protein